MFEGKLLTTTRMVAVDTRDPTIDDLTVGQGWLATNGFDRHLVGNGAGTDHQPTERLGINGVGGRSLAYDRL